MVRAEGNAQHRSLPNKVRAAREEKPASNPAPHLCVGARDARRSHACASSRRNLVRPTQGWRKSTMRTSRRAMWRKTVRAAQPVPGIVEKSNVAAMTRL